MKIVPAGIHMDIASDTLLKAKPASPNHLGMFGENAKYALGTVVKYAGIAASSIGMYELLNESKLTPLIENFRDNVPGMVAYAVDYVDHAYPFLKYLTYTARELDRVDPFVKCLAGGAVARIGHNLCGSAKKGKKRLRKAARSLSA